jgi:serine/threonine protein kinase
MAGSDITEFPPGHDAVQALIRATVVEPSKRLDRSPGEIARGGMASVEAAIDRTLGRRVALKLLHPEYQHSELAVRGFIREAQITGQLDHPNIVPIHELAVDSSGRLFFTMKLVEGRTLYDLIDSLRASHDRIDARGLKISTTVEHEELLRLLDVFVRLLDAIAFAHSRGVVHCDIKPENVMVGDYGQVYLMDWGIAKVMPERESSSFPRTTRVRDTLPPVTSAANMIVGTPTHMSPEQARGEQQLIDPRTDVFALGAVLFEILTGHPPYQGDDPAEVLALARACEPVLLPHLAIPQELRRIVGVAMNKDPAKRYQSVEQFRIDLQGFARGGDNFPRKRFSKGEWLIREGEVGDAAYILVFGRCEVSRQVKGKRESLRTLGPGDVFGETAILASTPRTASVIALTEVVAVIVTADVLEREVTAMKPWMGSFIRALAQRFSEVEKSGGGNAAKRAGVDPVQIANLALMTLKTWGRNNSMSALQLCEKIAKTCGLSEDEVLKILRQYAHFEIALAQDRISLRDERGLVEELRRFL